MVFVTKKKNFKTQGFTLIELLVVILIIATLAVSVFVAVNPGQRLKDARDAKRNSDVDAILTAVHEALVDNKGSAPTNLTAVEQQIGTATTGCAIATGGCTVTAVACADLMSGAVNLSKYLKTMPFDPLSGTAGTTKYSIVQDSNGLVTVKACATGTGTTEGTNNVSISR